MDYFTYGYSELEQMALNEEKRNGRIIVACGLCIFATPFIAIALYSLVA